MSKGEVTSILTLVTHLLLLESAIFDGWKVVQGKEEEGREVSLVRGWFVCGPVCSFILGISYLFHLLC